MARILVIEHDAVLAETIQRVLARRGGRRRDMQIDVTSSFTGARERLASTLAYDLIIVELDTDDRFLGRDLVAQWAESAPLLLISGRSRVALGLPSPRARVSFLRKPFSVSRLRRYVDRTLNTESQG